jgi:hypothetical protein
MAKKKKSKVFKNVESLKDYICSECYSEVIQEIKMDGLKTMKDVTDFQVKGYTGDILESIDVVEESDNHIVFAWKDNGGWYSISSKTYGKHMYAPWALEHGKVWDISGGSTPDNPIYKNATTLESSSTEIIEKDSINTLKRIMKKNGFKINK